MICLVLSSVSSLTVAAESSNYCSYSEFLEHYPEVSSISQYFFFTHTRVHPDDASIVYTNSYFVYPFSGSVEVSKDSNGFFVFHCSQGFRFGEVGYKNGVFDSIGGHLNYDLGNEFKYDPKTNTFIVSNADYPTFVDPITISNIKTTLTDVTFGDLYVEFTPELKGTVDYKIEIDGKKYDYPYLEFSITNTSNRDYQYSMFIVNKGEQIEYENIYSDYLDTESLNASYSGKFYSNNPVYAYVKNEWFYTILQHTDMKVNAPSAWHYLSAGNSFSDGIYWHQMKLEKGHDYDVVVLACKVNPFDENPNAFDYSPGYPISYVGDWCFRNLPNYPSEIYRSSFSVPSNTPFDPNNKETFSGAIAYDPDGNIDSLFDNIEGYYDSRNNDNLVLTDSDSHFSNFPVIGSSGSSSPGNSYDYSYSFKSDGSYRDLLNNSRSFFSFIASVLGYFPVSILTVVNLGLWSLLILSLIRRIK